MAAPSSPVSSNLQLQQRDVDGEHFEADIRCTSGGGSPRRKIKENGRLFQGIESHPRSKGGTQAEVDGGNAGIKECEFLGDDRVCIHPKLSAFKSNPAGG